MQKKLVRVANAILDLEPVTPKSTEYGDDDIGSITLLSNSNRVTAEPSSEVISAVKDFLDEGSLNQYPDPDSLLLNYKLTNYTGLSPEYIGCFPGERASLEYIARTFMEPGTEMLVSGPEPPEKLIAPTGVGASIVEVFHDDPFSPSLEAIINNINKRTRVLYLGNPSECTGSFFTEPELVFLLAYAENTLIVVDESYFEFSGFTVSHLVKKFPNLAVVRSFSHAFGLAGFKANYIITDPENLGYINRLRVGDAIDAVSQVAAIAALDNPDYMRKFIDTIEKSKDLVADNLPGFGYDFYISPADFFLIRVSDAIAVCEELRNEGFRVTDLSDFRQLEGFVRISYGAIDDTDRLLLLLSRMAERFATGFNRNRIKKSVNGEEIETPVKTGVK